MPFFVTPGNNAPGSGVLSVSGVSVDNTDPFNPLIKTATFISNRPPVATDDDTQGHFVTREWYDTVTGFLYVCLDNTTNAAVWESVVGNPNP